MTKKETYYLVQTPSAFGGRDVLGEFTEASWTEYIKGVNEDLMDDGYEEDELHDEEMEDSDDYFFTTIIKK
jgi:hypothetical protein